MFDSADVRFKVVTEIDRWAIELPRDKIDY